MAKSLQNIKSSRSFEQLTTQSTASKTVKEKPAPPKEEFINIDTDLISIDSNIRTEYDDAAIDELAQSMREYGQLEAIRVYEEKNGYKIIFGHRRWLAAKKANIHEMKSFVTQKPDTVDKLYIQAAENEHAVNISSADREKYIQLLHKDHNQTVEQIAQKLGKGTTWVYNSLNAHKIREKKEAYFNDAGITMTTEDALAINNFTDAEIEEAVDAITEKPDQKRSILKNLKKHKKNKMQGKPIVPMPDHADDNTNESSSITIDDDILSEAIPETSENISDPLDASKEINVTIVVYRNDDAMSVKFKTNSIGDAYDSRILPLLTEQLHTFYKNEGYTLEI